MDEQISMMDLLRKTAKAPEPVREKPDLSWQSVYVIPDDVWEGRCSLCIHKNSDQNIPIPVNMVHKVQYETLLPCRIMSLIRTDEIQGECLQFAPRMDVYGICESCQHNNIFEDSFCMKEDHAEQHRVFYGCHYGGDDRKVDYYSRHRLSVCDDYIPNQYARKDD